MLDQDNKDEFWVETKGIQATIFLKRKEKK
jgi:hypothetical protein